jgi:hypothetical protein
VRHELTSPLVFFPPATIDAAAILGDT